MIKVSKTTLIHTAAVAGVVLLAGCSQEPAELPVSLSSYEGTMKGTKFGAIVRPGDSASSTISILIEGRADPSINMPHGDRPPLTKEETGIIAKWINQGAKNN